MLPKTLTVLSGVISLKHFKDLALGTTWLTWIKTLYDTVYACVVTYSSCTDAGDMIGRHEQILQKILTADTYPSSATCPWTATGTETYTSCCSWTCHPGSLNTESLRSSPFSPPLKFMKGILGIAITFCFSALWLLNIYLPASPLRWPRLPT